MANSNTITLVRIEVIWNLASFQLAHNGERRQRPVSVSSSTVYWHAILGLFCCLHRTDATDLYCWSLGLPAVVEYSDPHELLILTGLARDEDREYVSRCTPGSPCMPRDDVSIRRDSPDVSELCKACIWLLIHKLQIFTRITDVFDRYRDQTHW